MIPVGQDTLSLEQFSEILFDKKTVTLTPSALDNIDTNFRFLQEFSSDKLIYGINTG